MEKNEWKDSRSRRLEVLHGGEFVILTAGKDL
jgi:hypothetical protein